MNKKELIMKGFSKAREEYPKERTMPENASPPCGRAGGVQHRLRYALLGNRTNRERTRWCNLTRHALQVICFAMAVFMCSCCPPFCPPETPSDKVFRIVKVMTFNVRRKGSEDKDKRKWANRKELVLKTINLASPEILGVQEAKKGQKNYILSHLEGAWGVVGEGRDSGSSGEHNPIYFRTDKFTLVDHDTLWYSDTPNTASRDESRKWGFPHMNRILTWAKLRDKVTQRYFWVFNTHWMNNAGAGNASTHRWESVKLLLETICDNLGSPSGSYPTNAGFIVMGDFNAGYSNDVMKFLRTGTETNGTRPFSAALQMADVYHEYTEGPWGTSHGWTGNYDCSRIDFILVQRSSWDVPYCTAYISHTHDSRTVPHPAGIGDFVINTWPSDHFPVVAEILWLNR